MWECGINKEDSVISHVNVLLKISVPLCLLCVSFMALCVITNASGAITRSFTEKTQSFTEKNNPLVSHEKLLKKTPIKTYLIVFK